MLCVWVLTGTFGLCLTTGGPCILESNGRFALHVAVAAAAALHVAVAAALHVACALCDAAAQCLAATGCVAAALRAGPCVWHRSALCVRCRVYCNIDNNLLMI